MSKWISKWLLGVWAVSMSAGAVVKSSDMTITPPAFTYTGAADAVTTGDLIGSQWSAIVNVATVFWCGYTVYMCNRATMSPGPSIVSAGMTMEMDGVSYQVYETGVPGIGFVIGLRDPGAASWIPLQTQTTQTYPVAGTSGAATDIGWSAQVTYVKTGESLASGVYTLPAIQAAVLNAYSDWGEVAPNAYVIIDSTTVTVTARGCIVNTPNASVDLGNVDIRTLNSVGAMSERKGFSVSLSCDENISLYATVSDANNPLNNSDAVSLTPDSTAQYVGVAFFYNGEGPLQLGRDDSSPGATGQFFIQSVSEAATLTLPFQVSYYRKGEIVPGTANALASITFSYQ
ncbi:fimbrial protein [Enterobacteriaceae bacterium BIT-l23]|uniref:fimbrial protein n=1 Tax=Jejubacter sp. L23 TaxID=3092086 RepID=UPI001584D51D|nr:fimbrial protein [Enterobacteriaceae bacterium BIT-l23]